MLREPEKRRFTIQLDTPAEAATVVTAYPAELMVSASVPGSIYGGISRLT